MPCNSHYNVVLQSAAICLQWSKRANAKQTEVFFVSRKCSEVQCGTVSADSIRTKSFEINYITVLQGKEKGEINFREHFLSRKGDNVKGCIALDFAPIENKFVHSFDSVWDTEQTSSYTLTESKFMLNHLHPLHQLQETRDL